MESNRCGCAGRADADYDIERLGKERSGANTTHAARKAIQRSNATNATLSKQRGDNPKTVKKWRNRDAVVDSPKGPKTVRSYVLGAEEEALCIAFRKYTLLPLAAMFVAHFRSYDPQNLSEKSSTFTGEVHLNSAAMRWLYRVGGLGLLVDDVAPF